MKKTLIWIMTVLITVAGAWYTRATGPTKPVKGSLIMNGETIKYRLVRTWFKPTDAAVKIKVENNEISGSFIHKRTPSHDTWSEKEMIRDGEYLIAFLPQLPPAGKVMYQITLQSENEQHKITETPIILRFRGDVPAWAMIPHILFMFAALLFSTRAGLAAAFSEKTFMLSLTTLIMLVISGLVFGPIVQQFAFGAYWTGWPFGTDLTDNKTAIMVLFWVAAMFKVWKNRSHRGLVLLASILLILIYLIPHSLMGSEIDFTQQ